MKAKYEKMIDAWVKKHYGDLERGVLSDEVKYKVLFKIYRKKYRKARETAKVLSDVVYSWHIKNDSEGEAPSPDKVLPKEEGFNHLVKEYKNLTPKHEDEVLPLCDTCKYQNKDGEFCEQDLVQNKDKDCYEYKHYMIP